MPQEWDSYERSIRDRNSEASTSRLKGLLAEIWGKTGEAWQTAPSDSFEDVDTVAGPMKVRSPYRGQYPTVVGTDLGREYDRLQKYNPRINERISRVQAGPGAAVGTAMQGGGPAKLSPEDFGRSNLLGIFLPEKGEININPSLGSPEHLRRYGKTSTYNEKLGDVLAHEMTHAAGYGETTAREGGTYENLLSNRPEDTKRKPRLKGLGPR